MLRLLLLLLLLPLLLLPLLLIRMLCFYCGGITAALSTGQRCLHDACST